MIEEGRAPPIERTLYSAADTEAREQRLWIGMLYAALAGYVAASAAILCYAALTWSQSNRGWIAVTVLSGLSFACAIHILRRRVVAASTRVVLFGFFSIVSFGLVLLLCILDGGINSPITYLYVVPMLYLSNGYPVRAVLVSGFAGLAGGCLLVGLNTGPVYGPTNMLQLMALLIGWLLAVISALNRERQDEAMRDMRLRLETLAVTDELTGCLNQRAFRQAMEQEITRAQRYEHELALLLIDVDQFKAINDSYGHLVGDTVLRELGALLRHTARDTDIAGRPGGDELAVLAPETNGEAAFKLADRIRAEMKTRCLEAGATLSIGICCVDQDTYDLTDMYRRADEALYVAKRRGRDQVAICEADERMRAT